MITDQSRNCEFPRHADIDLIKTAQAHLRALSQADFALVDEHSLRAASAPLRFLLVDGNLTRAWKTSGFGGPIQVEAYCFLSTPTADEVGFCGGGDMLPGIPFSTGWGNIQLGKKTLDIGAFLNNPCIYVKGTRISRHQLIKYIANTKGGTHYDPKGLSPKSRKDNFPLLCELEETGFAGLGIKVNNRNLVHHELSSIIQSVLRSGEVRRLQDMAVS
jgi:hypothetical protein